jgi:sugar-specific transcriptional regulator TrmB
VTVTKHSVTKKSEILTDIADEDENVALFKNIKNLKFHVKNLSDFKDVCSWLLKFGLSKNEAKVYLYLAKFGEQKAYKVSRSLSLHHTETYRILKRLEEKSLVYRKLEKPIRFAAIPVDKALENLIQKEKQKILLLEEEKESLLKTWDEVSVPIRDSVDLDEFIQVLKGRNQVYIKIKDIIKNAKNEVLIAASDKNLLQMFYSGALDGLAERSSLINVGLITDSPLRSSYIAKKLRIEEDKFSCVDFNGLPSFIISNNHLLLFLSSNGSNISDRRNGMRALWTNQKDMINVLKASFFILSQKKKFSKVAT